MLDSSMIWGEHVTAVVVKISWVVGCIQRIKHFAFNKNSEESVFCFDTIPYIDYCCTSWGSYAQIHRDKIQKFQNQHVRMILNEDYHLTAPCYSDWNGNQ